MQVYGHRGHMQAAGVAENSTAAVAAALAAGADGVEVDVRLTADGVPVCVHDRDLRRLLGWSFEVSRLTRAQLLSLSSTAGDPVASLTEITRAVRGRGTLIAEIKHDPPSSPAGLVATVLTHLASAQLGGDLIVSSFSSAVLAEIRQQLPGVRRALVTEPGSAAVAGLNEVLVWGHHELHAHAGSVLAHPQVADVARAEGRILRCWDVRRPIDAHLLHVAGVSGLIVDDPGLIKATLTNRAPLATGASL